MHDSIRIPPAQWGRAAGRAPEPVGARSKINKVPPTPTQRVSATAAAAHERRTD